MVTQSTTEVTEFTTIVTESMEEFERRDPIHLLIYMHEMTLPFQRRGLLSKIISSKKPKKTHR